MAIVVKILSLLILHLATATSSTAQLTQNTTLLENIADVIARAFTGVWTTSRSVVTTIVDAVSAAYAAIINIVKSALTYILELPLQLHYFATDLDRKQTYWKHNEGAGFLFPKKISERQCGLIVIVTALFYNICRKFLYRTPKAEVSCVFDKEGIEKISGDNEGTLLQADSPAAEDAEDVLLFFPNGDLCPIIELDGMEDDGMLYDTDDDTFDNDSWTSIDADITETDEALNDSGDESNKNVVNSQTEKECLDKLVISRDDESP